WRGLRASPAAPLTALPFGGTSAGHARSYDSRVHIARTPATRQRTPDNRCHPKGRARMTLNRREFLSTSAAVGGSMVLGFWLPPTVEAAQFALADPSYRDPLVAGLSASLTRPPPEPVTIRVGQTEMGTGVFTSCPMIVADELQCDWKKV